MSEPIPEAEAPAVVQVTRNLRAIEKMAADLPSEAVNRANSGLMPGGRAMVVLGPLSNIEAWENQQETTERTGRRYTSAEDEDPDDAWPAQQIIGYWSERIRREVGAEYGQRPTLLSESSFIRWQLPWAWQNLDTSTWTALTRDIATARTRLEDILTDGDRAERGAPCMYDECGGVRLVRKMVRARDTNGGKTWRQTDWHCPRCHRTWDEDAYARNITAAHERAKIEDINGTLWVTDDYAARRLGRPVKTIRTWINRGKVATACLIAGRRPSFVPLHEVEALHRDSKGRPPS